MDYSILKQIDTYIKENGIPFKSIYINVNYFPKSFNDAILSKLLEITQLKIDRLFEEYELFYHNNHLQLIARNKTGTTTLLIYDPSIGYSYNSVFTKISEKEVVDAAILIEEKKASKVQRLVEELGLIDGYSFNVLPFLIALDKGTKMCCSYIGYLNETYLEMLRDNKNNNYLEIAYLQPESTTVIRKINNFNGVGSRERINELLPLDDRRNILESYDYIYIGYAYSSSNKQIDYLCYLYSISNNQYALVMEPVSGNVYTKTFIFESDTLVSEEIFIKIVQERLGLSHEESLCDSQILLTKHTSIDLFKSTIENIIVGTDIDKRVHSYTKSKIEDMKMRREQ